MTARTARKAAMPRGFSVIELVVVLAVMAVLVPLAIRFTSETADIADVQAQRATLYRNTEDAIYQISQDLSNARSCRSSLMDVPVISIGSTSIEFISDIDGDGDGDYVKYWIDPSDDGNGANVLYRETATTPDGDDSSNGGVGNDDGVTSDDELCTFTVAANRSVEKISALPAGTSGYFSAYLPGEGDITSRVCRGLTSDFDQCDFSSVTITITQKSLVPDTPDITIKKEIAIDPRWGRT